MKNDVPLLDLMLIDLERQSDLYRPGPYWQAYAARAAAALRTCGLDGFRARDAVGKGYADTFGDDVIGLLPPGWRRDAMEAVRRLPLVRTLVSHHAHLLRKANRTAQEYKSLYYQAVLSDWFLDFASGRDLPETRLGDPARVVTLEGISLGELYLRVFGWIHDFGNHVDLSRVGTVFEIGGGFGAMAHSLLHLHPNVRRYVYLDVPPILYVGTQYLKQFFGDAVRDYAQTRDLDVIEFSEGRDREILAIAPWQLPKLRCAVDLFWNASSFQEMPEHVVRNYVRHVGRTLAPGGRCCYFVYKGGAQSELIDPSTLLDIMKAEAQIEPLPIETPISDRIFPGVGYMGGGPGVTR